MLAEGAPLVGIRPIVPSDYDYVHSIDEQLGMTSSGLARGDRGHVDPSEYPSMLWAGVLAQYVILRQAPQRQA